MPWHDKNVVQEVLNIQKQFGIKTFVETGTGGGMGVRFWSRYFDHVYSCDVDANVITRARDFLHRCNNVTVELMPSHKFLAKLRPQLTGPVLYLLDAHAMKEESPIPKELEALKGCNDCSIFIHDFVIESELNKGLEGNGQIRIDNIHDKIYLVNPNFCLYHNTYRNSKLWSDADVLETELFYDSDFPVDKRELWATRGSAKRGVMFMVPEILKKTTLQIARLRM